MLGIQHKHDRKNAYSLKAEPRWWRGKTQSQCLLTQDTHHTAGEGPPTTRQTGGIHKQPKTNTILQRNYPPIKKKKAYSDFLKEIHNFLKLKKSLYLKVSRCHGEELSRKGDRECEDAV